jgi:hypothetical protein
MADHSRKALVGNFFALILAAGAITIAPQGAKADTDFQARRMARNDVPLGKGQCDIRLRVDGEVEVSVQQDRVHVRTINGRDAADAGSECNEPIPSRLLEGFNFEKMDGRGDMQLLSPPDRQSGFRSVVRIRDSQGGDGRYHFRLSWQLDGGGPGRTTGRDTGTYGSYPDRGRGNGNDDYYGRDRVERRDSDRDQRGYDPGDRGMRRRISVEQAVNTCTDAVRAAINRDYRFANADIRNARLDDRPGRNDIIIGDATGRRGNGNSYGNREEFTFSCNVNFDNGNVRNVDVRRR